MKLKTKTSSKRNTGDFNSGTVMKCGQWYRVARMSLIIVCLLAVAGCRQDMQDQPKFIPLRPNPMFEDNGSARTLVDGTVPRAPARASFRPSWLQNTEKENPFLRLSDPSKVTEAPFPLTEQLLDRGQERFNINCAPCHGRVGDGRGMVVQRGFRQPPSYHIDRLREAPLGHFYDVMTNGFGAMSSYSDQVAPSDRWAIAVYIRALQLSQHASVAEVPSTKRGSLDVGEPRK